ncbi:M56 family metallopeptidase [Maioricimonas sp. JC845]|uniref:M56 family metallopeptidase n=1 Tax=Maioricimonas sp. JC845 TaxID=3232138 RepID=UPI003458FF02
MTAMLTVATIHLLQVTVLVVIVAGLLRLTARSRPHLAYVLWLVVLLKCLVPPVWSSPSSVWNWLPLPTVMHGDRARLQKEEQPGGVRYFAAPVVGRAATGIDPPATAAALVSRHAGGGRLPGFLTGLLLVVWGIGTCCWIAVTCIRVRRCRRRIHQGLQEPPEELLQLMSCLRQRLGVRHRVRLHVTEAPIGPAVMGWLRPVLVLPAAIVRGKSAQELEPLVAHELIHIRRGDLWTGLLQAGAGAVWWFHPLVAYAGRSLSRETERCCDEQVVAELGCDPVRYACCLLDVLERKRELSAVPVVPGLRPVDVTRDRMERIMKLGHSSRKRTPVWCWLVMALVGLMALPGGANDTPADKVEQPAKESKAKTHESGGLLFGVGVNSDAGVTGEIQVQSDWEEAVRGRNELQRSDEEQGNKSDGDTLMTLRVYRVADLVVPQPGWKMKHLGGQPGDVHQNGARLMAELARAVAPESWNAENGDARLAFDDRKLSLVVLQTPSNHDAIAQYLMSLRNQFCQVMIRVRMASVSKGDVETLLDGGKQRVVKSQDAAVVSQLLQKASGTSAPSVAAITLMDGQGGMLPAAPFGGRPYAMVTMVADVAEDRRTIDIVAAVTVTPRANDPVETLLRSRRVTVPDSGVVILDVTEDIARNHPIDKRQLLILTPQVIVPEEEIHVSEEVEEIPGR